MGRMPDLPDGSHFLEYSWKGYRPELRFYDPVKDGVVTLAPGAGDQVEFVFSGAPTCTGIIRDDGSYEPCPDGRAPMVGFTWCPTCAKEVIPHPSCIFEPRCDGRLCPDAFCSRPHVVYLAFFGPRAKVGMTSRSRVEERLTEQGADAYMVLGSTDNREQARALEKRLARTLRLPQAVRGSTKLKLVGGVPDRRAMAVRAQTVGRAVRNLTGEAPEELVILDGYPLKQPLRGRLGKVDPGGEVRGEIIGLKGPFVFLDDGSGRKMVWEPDDSVCLYLRTG